MGQRISVIIITKDRPEELKNVLFSVLRQTRIPDEVIVVDDSSHHATKFLCEQVFSSLNIRYVRNTGIKNIPAARNVGIEYAVGDFVCFLDDDFEIDQAYLECILDVFKTFSQAKGVMGYDMNSWMLSLPKWVHVLFRLMGRPYMLKDTCELNATVATVYPKPLTKIINTQWLAGNNMCFSKHVFDEFRFDERALGEDLEFTYRIYLKYSDALFITPYAKGFHKFSIKGRMDQMVRFHTINSQERYIFKKLIPKTPLNVLHFMWSRLLMYVAFPVIYFKSKKKLEGQIFVLQSLLNKKFGEV